MTQVEVGIQAIRDEAISSFWRVWDTSVCLPLSPRVRDTDHTALRTDPLVGSVAWIGGSWTGNVRIFMNRTVAEELTRALLTQAQVPHPDEITLEEVQDSLRELANMIAGNLKASLPGKCGLATPGNFSIESTDPIEDDFFPILHEEFETEKGTLFFTVAELERRDFQSSKQDLTS